MCPELLENAPKCTQIWSAAGSRPGGPPLTGLQNPASQTLVGGELNTWKGTTLCISCMVCWSILVILSCAVKKVDTLMRNNYKAVCSEKLRRQTLDALLPCKNDRRLPRVHQHAQTDQSYNFCAQKCSGMHQNARNLTSRRIASQRTAPHRASKSRVADTCWG